MSSDHAIPILVIGLFVAFGMGFLVGSTSREAGLSYPANYNPGQAIVAEATKAAEAHVRECYQMMIAQLQKDHAVTETAH